MADLDKITEKSARGSFHLFIGNLISEISNAVGIIIVARLLTPEDMGIYGLSFILSGARAHRVEGKRTGQERGLDCG